MTMCVVDDDAKTFEFHVVVCCYALRGGEDELEREERFLASRGYARGEVKL
jgi:hypothetical protein